MFVANGIIFAKPWAFNRDMDPHDNAAQAAACSSGVRSNWCMFLTRTSKGLTLTVRRLVSLLYEKVTCPDFRANTV